MFCVVEKLKLLQSDLKALNTKEFSSISKRVIDTKLQLELLQRNLASDPSNTVTQAKERDIYKQYVVLVRAEESLARQKSRI